MPNPSELLNQKFPFTPTEGQKVLFGQIDDFILTKDDKKRVLLLKGYAGTGKTTVVSSLVKILYKFDYIPQMIAPTGRAAKVMSTYAGRHAYTIHKTIFKQSADPRTGQLVFKRQKNLFKNTIFIVDEASMIHDEAENGGKGLLTDLVDYVFQQPTNKLFIIGDGAQLPPVKYPNSPALDATYLTDHFSLHVTEAELTEVVRQESESGILKNATGLRQLLNGTDLNIKFSTRGYNDIYRMRGDKLEDGLQYAYKKFGMENTIVLCRSNKVAVQYNQFIRRTILGKESELDAGDLVMVVKNNYTCLDEESPAGFIANGDFAEVLKVRKLESLYGFRFATLELRLLDYPYQEPFESKVVLDTLHSGTPSLTMEEVRAMQDAVLEDYMDLPTVKERMAALRTDSYLNALQIKFAYALTCHKSQGGQWDAVFVEQGFLRDDMINSEFIRWLYTALTRATNQLFLVNFNDRFFG